MFPRNPFSSALLLIFLGALITVSSTQARLVEYDLTIEEKTVSPAGKHTHGLTINGGIPGPVLRFVEGDTARIRVHNRLSKETTSIHWHGLILPNIQDGVPDVTTPRIQPGTTHVFEFPLIHSGTYWYHSHTHLQEQSGVYGAIVVLPRGGEPHLTAHDYVLQLSDWTNEHPHQVLKSLMRGEEYYAVKKGNAQSILGAWKAGASGNYWSQLWGRMPPMDISDVAYDAFLINGQRLSRLPGKKGDRVRLRLINSGASTYFYVSSATGSMTIVAADGVPVQPLRVKRLLIGMAETYDVLITLPGEGAWEVRATAQDGSGRAAVLIGNGDGEHHATDPPNPDLYSMDDMLDMALGGDDHREMEESDRPGPPYEQLRATRPTTFRKSLPVRTIPLSLTGDMERYQWSFNGKTMAEDSTILIKKGEVIRLEMINNTMMHHPLHLHGHFFRVLNQQGNWSPLKHTVDLPPMGRRTIEFEANEDGDWLFHCHLLYHMMTGMARVFSYEKPGHVVNVGDHGSDPWGFWGEAAIMSHMTEGSLTLRHRKDDFYAIWEAGWQDVDDFEYEAEALYERYLGPNFRAFLGGRFTHDEDTESRAVAGVRYRLPLLFWSSASVDSEGDLRLGLEGALRISSRLSAFGKVQYDTDSEWEYAVGAEYLLNKPVSLVTQYHSEYGFGGGLTIRF